MKQENTKILLDTKDEYVVLEIATIIRVEALGNYCKVFTYKQMIICNDSFKDICDKLSQGFFQCHKSHLISINEIDRILKTNFVILRDGSEIPLARRRKDELIDLFNPKNGQK